MKRALDSCQCSDPFDPKTYHSLWDLIQTWRMLGQVQLLKQLSRSACQQHPETILAVPPACAMFQVKVASQRPAAFQSPLCFSDYYHHRANSSSVHELSRHLPFAPSFQVFCLFFDQQHPQSFHRIESGLNDHEVSRTLKYFVQPFTMHDLLASIESDLGSPTGANWNHIQTKENKFLPIGMLNHIIIVDCNIINPSLLQNLGERSVQHYQAGNMKICQLVHLASRDTF